MIIDISICVNENKYPWFRRPYVGYIELDEFDANQCFHLCNWEHWSNIRPKNLHSNISSCGHGICFENPESGELWLAKSIGWLVGDEQMIHDYVKEHIDSDIWV